MAPPTLRSTAVTRAKDGFFQILSLSDFLRFCLPQVVWAYWRHLYRRYSLQTVEFGRLLASFLEAIEPEKLRVIAAKCFFLAFEPERVHILPI